MNSSISEINSHPSPYIVGTLASLANLPKSPQCHIVEFRLDQFGITTDWIPKAQFLSREGIDILVTLRSRIEGGVWDTESTQKEQLLKDAYQHARWIDIEHTSPLCQPLCDYALSINKQIIVSRHFFESTPPQEELISIIKNIQSLGDHVIPKLVTTINTEDEFNQLKTLSKSITADHCVMGMGALGSQSRLELPNHGSTMVYGYLDNALVSGQLSAEELYNHFYS